MPSHALVGQMNAGAPQCREEAHVFGKTWKKTRQHDGITLKQYSNHMLDPWQVCYRIKTTAAMVMDEIPYMFGSIHLSQIMFTYLLFLYNCVL